MSAPALETKGLWFAYEDGPPALHGISLTIESGAFVAVIGPNGSGKSTLARHFNGLLRPGRGQVMVQGQDAAGQSIGALARQVGYVFQNPDHQIFSATTREEIAFGPRNVGLDETAVRQRTEETLVRFGLSVVAERPPATLSYGLRRKVAVAAVYAMQTPVLILDEPTTGLDQRNTTELMGHVVERHRQGHTIVLITHDMRLVAAYAPRCLVLDGGQVAAYGPTRAVFSKQYSVSQYAVGGPGVVELPQVTELGRRLGYEEVVLTVAEFCRAYRPERR